MGIRDVASVLADVPTLLALKKGMVPRPLEEQDCMAAAVERNAAQMGDKPAVVCPAPNGAIATVTWAEFNALANRYAHMLKSGGVQRGDVVSVMMENRIEFLALLMGANKLGVTAGLINTNLRQRPLSHCITVTASKKCIFGAEVQDAIQEVKGDLELREGEDYYVLPDAGNSAAPEPANWAIDAEAASAEQPQTNPPDTAETTLGETAMYIFTSGTTGLPKAAILSNRRYLASAQLAGTAGLRCTPEDRLYICLPLYHGTGLMIGAGAAFATGASMFVRRRFSASAFLDEVRQHRCTCFIYVGELCRYLDNTPVRPDDHDSPLATMMGNGLRPDVWLRFKKRFGIKRITEFYGASEGNVAFANLLNKDCTIGMTSSRVALVRYDVDADEIARDADGRCVEAAKGEPGLLLGHINPSAAFEGYTDADATEKKVLRDVFETGDAWFNTGDLIREVEVGFSLGYAHYQFVDPHRRHVPLEVRERLHERGERHRERLPRHRVLQRLRRGGARRRRARRHGGDQHGGRRRGGGFRGPGGPHAARAAALRPPGLRARPVRHGVDRHLQDGQGRPQARGLRHRRDRRSRVRDEAEQRRLRALGRRLPGDHPRRQRGLLTSPSRRGGGRRVPARDGFACRQASPGESPTKNRGDFLHGLQTSPVFSGTEAWSPCRFTRKRRSAWTEEWCSGGDFRTARSKARTPVWRRAAAAAGDPRGTAARSNDARRCRARSTAPWANRSRRASRSLSRAVAAGSGQSAAAG